MSTRFLSLSLSAVALSALALTAPLAEAYGVPAATLAVYFFDRSRDEVAHGGQLSCDADPA